MDALTQPATTLEFTDEEKLSAALAEFQAADRELGETIQRLREYERTHVDQRPTIIGPQIDIRVGKAAPERERLERERATAIERFGVCMHAWSELKQSMEANNG